MNKKVDYLENNLSRINKALIDSLPKKNFSEITEAIHYSVMNGGKKNATTVDATHGRIFKSRSKKQDNRP